MKGGTRTGAGRPKGKKDSKPREGTGARREYEQIQKLLSYALPAKAKMYQEFLFRIENKDKKQKPLSLPEKKLMAQLAIDLAVATGEEKKDLTDLEASEFLRKVWNDPGIDMSLRIRAAEVALKGADGPKGKKEEKSDKAKSAGAGRFAAGAPPMKLVKG